MKLKLNHILCLLCLVPMIIMGAVYHMEDSFYSQFINRTEARHDTSEEISSELQRIEYDIYVDYLDSHGSHVKNIQKLNKILIKVDLLILKVNGLGEKFSEIGSTQIRGRYLEFSSSIGRDIQQLRTEIFNFYNIKPSITSDKFEDLNNIIFLIGDIDQRLDKSVHELKVIEVENNSRFRDEIKIVVVMGGAFVMLFLVLVACLIKNITNQLRTVSFRLGEKVKNNKKFFINDFDILYQRIVNSNNLIIQQKREIAISARTSEAGELTANLAHELKTPLAIISSGQTVIIKRIKKNTIKPDEISIALERSNLQLVKVGNVIDSIRKTARDSTDEKMSDVSLVNILRDVEYASNYRLGSTNISFFSTFKDSNVLLICKEVQVIQIILNLINNSADALHNTKEKWISIEGKITETDITLYFTDSGKGIPKAVADNMFERYYTTKSAEDGTGIGLDLCRKMMNEMGGSINYDHDHENTRFILKFTKFKYKEDEEWEKAAS